ncbi:hypothetical protein C4F50_04485 [Flavobacterium sp. KB82]|uniref:Uncharacterized protein n=1 Tax=Flavobacterium hungaricum TaxID=2082725 RepID=A0ABR9TFQ8_9FLAO|nr:hypothetical protein [Flavobacterium hungaricum]
MRGFDSAQTDKKKERTIPNELFYFSIISNFISRRFKKDLSRYRRLFKHKIKKNLRERKS